MVGRIKYDQAEIEGADVNDLKVMSDSNIAGVIKEFAGELYDGNVSMCHAVGN